MTTKEFTSVLIRLILGFIYLSAGLSKLAPEHIGNIIGPVDLSAMADDWRIDLIMIVTAIVQVIGGALIVSQRYSLVGLIFIFPLSIGILILTIFTGFGGTVFINIFLLLIHGFALLTDPQFWQLLKKRNQKNQLKSDPVRLFPGKLLPHLAMAIWILIIPLSAIGGIYLNVLSTLALLLLTILQLPAEQL